MSSGRYPRPVRSSLRAFVVLLAIPATPTARLPLGGPGLVGARPGPHDRSQSCHAPPSNMPGSASRGSTAPACARTPRPAAPTTPASPRPAAPASPLSPRHARPRPDRCAVEGAAAAGPDAAADPESAPGAGTAPGPGPDPEGASGNPGAGPDVGADPRPGDPGTCPAAGPAADPGAGPAAG